MALVGGLCGARARPAGVRGPAERASSLRLVGGGIAAVVACAPHAAPAQVIAIGAGGAVAVYDRPATFDGDGAHPIAPLAARPGRPMRRDAVAAPASRRLLTAAAADAALSPDLIEAVAWSESRLRPGRVSPKGAVGEMQLMPATARGLHVDPTDSGQNYRGGALYLRQLLARYDGDLVRALAAYNAGPAAVDRHHGAPPYKETQAYVAAVLEHLSRRAEQATR